MKLHRFLLLAGITGLLVFSVTAAAARADEEAPPYDPYPETGCMDAAEQESDAEHALRILYLIAEQDGVVSVYDVQRQTVIHTLRINPTRLPEQDQKRLKCGIPVYSDPELSELISSLSG